MAAILLPGLWECAGRATREMNRAMKDRRYSPHDPYHGDRCVGSKEIITYGINYLTPVEMIREFCNYR